MNKIDHTRINAAIAKAEATTSGEITCVIKRTPLSYPETPFIWAIGAAFLVPLLLSVLGLWPVDALLNALPNDLKTWQAGHEAAKAMLDLERAGAFVVLQLLVFGLCYLIISQHPLRLWLTPRAIIKRRAHQKAIEQFSARGLHLTKGQTGVMIFCALSEHYVEVIADEGIYSRVDKKFWDETIATLLSHIKRDDLTGGFEAAITKCGEALSVHFPPDSVNLNELPDVLIEI